VLFSGDRTIEMAAVALIVALMMQNGCASKALKNSPNWHEGRFHNLDGEEAQNRALGFLKWKLFARRGPFPEELAHAAPRVEAEIGQFRQEDFEGIMWVGHATTLIRLAGVNVLTDPLWGEPSSYHCRLVPQAVPVDRLPVLDAVLISHGHREHLDLPTLKQLSRDALYCVPLGLGKVLRKRAKQNTLVEFDWWQSHEVRPGVTVTLVPAHHWSRRGLFDQNKALWGGWIIESGETRVYYAGDTALAPVLKEIGLRFPGIDYAILPVGAYEPRWYMKTMHMNPSDAVLAFADLRAQFLIPVHWGTLQLGDEPPGEAPVALRREARKLGIPRRALRVLAVGETVTIRHPAAASRSSRPHA
jgi:L-ascorbate metabolism protein UlaG (beta-lactamase superfamily)